MYDSTEVLIVGAGPAGMALALSLAKFEISSVLLEKEVEITEDPRGVYLTHDAIRILWDLGLGDYMNTIGHESLVTRFFKTTIRNPPFFAIESAHDGFSHALPNGWFQIQPELERALQKRVDETRFCDLRRGCTVVDRDQTGTQIVAKYTDAQGITKSVRGSWLIGADGKTGIVRKHFLESSAGIRQVYSDYRYDGTWVAANLKMTLPTPQTHPDFPLWKMGYTPEEVYSLYWPEGWNFASPPGKPLAAGRFGPHEARLWRHEFAQNDWDDSMDSEELLWEHLTPMITLKKGKNGEDFPGEVTYPRDCIDILRCRPFRFTHKVVNKWFDNRTILIGDAAHVFPPFGGQGIASGVRDAHQLAWRLLVLQRASDTSRDFRDTVLRAWARERTASVKSAANFTKLNGVLCNEGDSWGFWILRNVEWAIRKLPLLRNLPDPMAAGEAKGFKSCRGGSFSTQFSGGGRIPQVYVSSQLNGPVLSDTLLGKSPTAMTLLVLADKYPESDEAEAKEALEQVRLPKSILDEDSIIMICPTSHDSKPASTEVYFPTPMEDLSHLDVYGRPLYAPSNFFSRFTSLTKFVIVRSDLFIYGLTNHYPDLVVCLTELKRSLGGS
ncbi:monooxygenase-like protein [Xylariaceae sp. FL1272]|nr:monooxygenase-like protein [Xylariaceae sp. FL1272]